MEKVDEYTQATDHGYEQTLMKYQAPNCQGCPLHCVCHRQKGNRTIEINHPLRKYRAQARERLLSEAGLIHRKKRPADVEAVIGNIKYNKNFRRFMLRGLKKVEIEMGLLAIAHNRARMMN